MFFQVIKKVIKIVGINYFNRYNFLNGKSMNKEEKKIIFETSRLILREYTLDDFDELYKMLSDPITMKHYLKPYDEEGTRRWISWSLDNYKKYGFGLWAIELKETGQFIGDCGITIQNIDGELLPEIGYHIYKDYQGKGFGKEAGLKVRDWVFNKTKYDEVYSYMTSSNVASYSLAKSLGMEKIKEYKDDHEGILFVYCIQRSKWEDIIQYCD